MRYIIGFLSLFIIYFITNGVSVMIRKPRDDESNVVALPKFVLIVGIIASFVFLIPTIITIFAENKYMIFFSAFFAVFSLIGVALIVAYINCWIAFNEDDFTYKTFFGIKHTIQYKDLTAIQGQHKDVKLFAGKHVIRVDEGAINNQRFISHAQKQYRKYHNGTAIPKVVKKDLFNNHVENPGEFIFVFGMLAVFFLGLTIVISCMSVPEKKTEFEAKTIVIDKHEILEEDLWLSDASGATYQVREYDSVIINAKDFFDKLESKPELNLFVMYNEKADVPYYTVSSIEKEGEQYLSFNAWYKNEWKSSILGIGAFIIIDLLILIFIWFAIYVGRNPHKFSDRVLHIFFKPGYIHRD